MTHSQELYKLLTETVIPEVEGFMQSMSAYLETNEATDELKQDQEGIRMIHQNFLDIMTAIEEGEIEEENCKQLIEEITMLRAMGNEAGVAEA
jgi:hypothetical protein